jgi:hypothetical protein
LINGKAVSFLGDKYKAGLLFSRGGTYTEEDPFIEYDLKGKYSLLTGKVSMITAVSMLGQELSIRQHDLVKLVFYVDDEVVHTTPWTNPTMDISFSVDLSGAQKLKIAIVGEQDYVGNCIALTGLDLL